MDVHFGQISHVLEVHVIVHDICWSDRVRLASSMSINLAAKPVAGMDVQIFQGKKY